MDDHDTYQHVVTTEDVDPRERDRIANRVEELYEGDGEVRFTAAESGQMELSVPDRIPRTQHDDVRMILREELSLTLDRFEQFILELHVNWPRSRYRVCVGYE